MTDGLSAPSQPLGFVVAFVLGVAALLALGLFVASLVPTTGAATVAGMLLFFPSMFLGGVYVPREVLPVSLGCIGELTPLGALRGRMPGVPWE